MAQYDIKLDANELVGLLTNNDQFSSLMETVINQVLDAQMTEHLGAEMHERNDDRQGYRNGYRIRRLSTRVGHLTLRVPQTRDGSFSTEIFKRYQRKEQAFVLGLMEMYLQGVSTRKVTKVTESLCGVSISKSVVSELTAELDVRVDAFKNRRLDDKTYPFIIVDALVLDVRKDDVVRMMGMLIAYGVNHEGKREMLGLWLGDTESETTWSQLFQDLKDRGLSGVDLVVSDHHSGLISALRKHFQSAAWQRCQVHFMRNVMGNAARKDRKEIADHLKTILYAHERKTAKKLADEFIERYEKTHKNVVRCFQSGFESAITVLSYPAEYRQRLRTTNLAERVNEEIRRRQKVLRIFPNEASAIRIVGALLSDWHDEWISGKRYFDMNNYYEWKKELAENKTDENVVQLIKA
jgi:transposase-like protein